MWLLSAISHLLKPAVVQVDRSYMNIPMTGISEIDHDHIAIVDLLSKVTIKMDHRDFLDFSIHVLDYVSRHVRHEEALMLKEEYPGFRMHQLEHESLRNFIKVYLRPNGEIDKDPMDIVMECKAAFKHHIIHHDIPLANFLKDKSV